MAHIPGHDRSQLLLLPEAIDDYVAADNPVRFVRRELWTSPIFAGSPDYRDAPKLSADVLNRLLLIACRPP